MTIFYFMLQKSKKLISISLAPNLTPKDIKIAKKFLFSPPSFSKWKQGKCINQLQQYLQNYFNVLNIYLFNFGRSGLYIILKTLNLSKNDEIIIQGYTCVVVPNAIIYNNAKPIYVDIDPKTYNMDPDKIEKKITSKTKAIIVQHSFGLSADMDKILKIAKKHNLFVIEDCAISLGATYNNKKLGTLGDASIFSFGRDKVISSVNGGAVIINNKIFNKKFKKEYDKILFPNRKEIFQNLWHLFTINLAKKYYNTFSLGKLIIYINQKLKLYNKAYQPQELQIQKPKNIPCKLPNAMATIIVNQTQQLDKFNSHRKVIANFYTQQLKNNPKLTLPQTFDNKEHIFLRYLVLVDNPEIIIKKAKQEHILLGDWYKQVIVPTNISLNKIFYEKGDCPIAEEISKKSLNLPTYYNLKFEDAKHITNLVLDNL